jgi:hypothetical protein
VICNIPSDALPLLIFLVAGPCFTVLDLDACILSIDFLQRIMDLGLLYRFIHLEPIHNFYAGLEVFRAVVMKSSVFWDITPLKVNRRFGGTCRLHFQGRMWR